MLKKFINYIKNSKQELKRVVWPTKKETFNHTLIVIGISVGVAIFLGIVDFILSKVLEIVIK
jgi:preprotein translocase subunit SecE